jgi:hypothetical protein
LGHQAPLVAVNRNLRDAEILRRRNADRDGRCSGGVALALPLSGYLPATIALFWVVGFLSATHDIAADGVYINAMSSTEQARYMGLQGVFWYAGKILASGLLVSFTGYLHSTEKGLGLPWTQSWMIVMTLMGAVMLVMGLWHRWVLPVGGKPAQLDERAGDRKDVSHGFADVFTSYFKKRDIWLMISFILLYRLGEGFLEKLGPLFLLDGREAGGLGLDNFEVGNINGTFGSGAFILGALLGGWIAARFGLERTLILFSLMLNVPHLTFVFPERGATHQCPVDHHVCRHRKAGVRYRLRGPLPLHDAASSSRELQDGALRDIQWVDGLVHDGHWNGEWCPANRCRLQVVFHHRHVCDHPLAVRQLARALQRGA